MRMTPRRIRYVRKRLGLSQAQLGRLLNVHQTLISHWEHGSRTPDEYQQEQLLHLYESVLKLDENGQQKFQTLVAQGLVAGALAFLIAVGIGLVAGDDPDQGP